MMQLESFGMSYGERVVLANVDLQLQCPGMLVLMGPSGGGKSTLLRMLAGLDHDRPDIRCWGTLELPGVATLVQQKARMTLASVHENLAAGLPNRGKLTQAEQSTLFRTHLDRLGIGELVPDLRAEAGQLPRHVIRLLTIARELIGEPALLLVDEPLSELPDEAAAPILSLLRNEAKRRGVIVVTHHQRRAAKLGGQFALLAGGVVVEAGATDAFFARPQTQDGRDFLRTGGCRVPSPSAKAEELAEDSPPPAPLPSNAVAVPSQSVGPRGFRWLIPGQIGGMPRPGIGMAGPAALDWDLEALERLGVHVLVNLEEQVHYSSAKVRASGLDLQHLPMVDMEPPTLEEAERWCRMFESRIATGKTVVVHCRAGLGRTGTMLCAYLIHQNQTATFSLQYARRIEPKWVQSRAQEMFLQQFSETIRLREKTTESRKT